MTIAHVILGRRLVEGQTGRILRESAGISLREAARHLGVDSRTLARWELGHTEPRPRAAARWYEFCQELANLIEEAPSGTAS